jgi:hypothetical protein
VETGFGKDHAQTKNKATSLFSDAELRLEAGRLLKAVHG